MGGFAAPYVPFGAAVGQLTGVFRRDCSVAPPLAPRDRSGRSTTAAIRAVVGGSRRRQPPAGTGQAPLLLTPERHGGSTMAQETEVGSAAELVPGVVRGAGRYAVGNAAGELFAVTRRCRHLGADLANGSIDREGCLVCPWHGARYDVATGRMMRGPQGVFAKIPGMDAAYRLLTRALPLGRGEVVERDGTVFVR
jgi:nitrite reductase/ring-hydroxylating ferredoxin subunit